MTGSLHVVQAGLELSLILLPLFPKCGVTGAFLLEAVFEVLVMVGSVMVLHRVHTTWHSLPCFSSGPRMGTEDRMRGHPLPYAFAFLGNFVRNNLQTSLRQCPFHSPAPPTPSLQSSGHSNPIFAWPQS